MAPSVDFLCWIFPVHTSRSRPVKSVVIPKKAIRISFTICLGLLKEWRSHQKSRQRYQKTITK
ncbi:hypothetical protein CaCOL14_007390 [Colletotrichum acutatum]|uniref:Uncharacterized protein n=1 Tax=Glomerella acutata TaxID=27357 RepID=A0AAD8UDX2_GLOAC|nr:uncharacterized protein BDZ83DRAFT_636497 [Colletotrichum acutatum]KAK1714568.1 hypothetical protein BDZ83DRAFT_636497 [Colletotrichum acutatum]